KGPVVLPVRTLHMIIGAQEGVDALGAMAHVGVGLAGRVIPLVMLARACESGEGGMDVLPRPCWRRARWVPLRPLVRRVKWQRRRASKRGTHQHDQTEHMRP